MGFTLLASRKHCTYFYWLILARLQPSWPMLSVDLKVQQEAQHGPVLQSPAACITSWPRKHQLHSDTPAQGSDVGRVTARVRLVAWAASVFHNQW